MISRWLAERRSRASLERHYQREPYVRARNGSGCGRAIDWPRSRELLEERPNRLAVR
jgi:hypothetical protein